MVELSDLTRRVLLKRSTAQKTWPTNGILTYLARLVLPTACQEKRKLSVLVARVNEYEALKLKINISDVI